MPECNANQARGRHAARRAGFTLVELLVSMAAVLVVALGMAAIFRGVGDAVEAGRRASFFNQSSRLIEQQLRADFARMTRDGFLVIRQQYADANGDGRFTPRGVGQPVDIAAQDVVPAAPDQPASRWRTRRIDEIAFFARGDFESVRPGLGVQGWHPTSGEARIYYGHGQRMVRPTDDPGIGARFDDVLVNDNNGRAGLTVDPRLGVRNATPGANPNYYAESWLLLRVATLLIPASSPTTQVTPDGLVFPGGVGTTTLLDKEAQVRGQPASPTLFRTINRSDIVAFAGGPPTFNLAEQFWFATRPTGGPNFDLNLGGGSRGPDIRSGVVDIATTSIAEVRAFVEGFAQTQQPYNTAPYAGAVLAQDYGAIAGVPASTFPPTFIWTGAGQVLATRPPANQLESVDYIHSWMDASMPGRASHDPVLGANVLIPGGGTDEPTSNAGVRIRAESDPAALLPRLGAAINNLTDAAARSEAALRADRQMLQQQVLSARVTEFRVDWTFGEVDDDGEAVWYGPDEGSGGAGGYYEYGYGTGGLIAQPQDIPGTAGVRGIAREFRARLPGATADADLFYPVSERLIYGYSPNEAQAINGGFPLLSVSSFFGWRDPTFYLDQDPAYAPPATTTYGNGRLTDGGAGTIADPSDVPASAVPPGADRWPWPTKVRVRVTLADPADPDFESTSEYVFNVPSK